LKTSTSSHSKVNSHFAMLKSADKHLHTPESNQTLRSEIKHFAHSRVKPDTPEWRQTLCTLRSQTRHSGVKLSILHTPEWSQTFHTLRSAWIVKTLLFTSSLVVKIMLINGLHYSFYDEKSFYLELVVVLP